ncbi:hypothetical protein [Amycolatopsis australiensis]|uniref:Transposase n=1 Tax=Amycolatopsis australiensis TaxID=546364 RepID=A0A1K1SRI2_9PSEU|nr:hypothetical protein [Amycolatopsis australiensis]SFW86679.1 hypothetical protein SAMN04489730_6467 [Amycolatopsis australiensis]
MTRAGQRLPWRATPRFDAEVCKQHPATGWAQRAAYYQAELTSAAIVLWLRRLRGLPPCEH